MPEKTAVKRSKFAQFLNTGTAANPVWKRFGTGIADNSVSYNASVTSETFIHEDMATNSIDSYAPSVPVTQYAYTGDGVFEFVDNIRYNGLTATDAESEVLFIDIYDATGSSYRAYKQACAIQIDSFGGAGGQRLQIGYTVLLNGDPTLGSATINANGEPTFTAAQ